MQTGGEKKARWGRRAALVILVIVGIWLFATSLVSVPPNTMIAVKEPGGVRALINKSSSASLRWKCPYIPGITGYKEEEVKLPAVKEVSTSFAFYTADEVTGKPEDKTKARAYFIDVKFKVVDWEKYLKIDLDKMNEQRRQASPWYPLIKERAGLIAEPIANVIRGGGSVDRFGRPIKTEDGRPAMDLSNRINYFQQELTSRRNIVICLMDAFGLETFEEIKDYLKEKEPWMFFAGVSTFEQLAEQSRQIQVYTMSELTLGLTPEGGQKRFVFGTDRLRLFAQAHRAYEYQEFLMKTKQNLEEIGLKRKEFTGRVDKVDKSLRLQAELLVDSFEAWIKMNGGDIRFIQSQEQLSQSYQTFLGQIRDNIVLAFRGAEIEALNKAIVEAQKKFSESPLKEEERLEAEKNVIGFFDLIKREVPRELGQLSAQDLSQIFGYYIQENNLEERLSPETLSYLGLKITTAYIEAVAEKVEEAEKFLADIKIAREFYEDIKAKIQGQQVDMIQAIEAYLQKTKGDLLQVASYLMNFSWQEGTISWQKVQWEGVVEEDLIPFFKHYSTSDDELAMTIRRITAEENEALWDAAIKEVLEGEDISRYGSYWVHHLKEGETLTEIAEKYNVGWQALFGPTPRPMVMQRVFQSIEEEKMVEFNKLVAQAMESGDYSKVYEFVKELPLKPLLGRRIGDIILVNKVSSEYSQDWFELDKANREKREKIIKRYFWPWVEKFAPKVIEDYFYSPNSPWVNHIENTYGVELLEVRLRIENDEMVDKSGSVKLEYYDLYLSEIEDWTVEEEDK